MPLCIKACTFHRWEAEASFQKAEPQICYQTGPAHKEKNHLDDTVVVPFFPPSLKPLPHSWKAAVSRCVLTYQWRGVSTITLRHMHSVTLLMHNWKKGTKKTSWDYLSAIPQGLAFPRKSWSHIRGSEGACGLQQISSHFPTYSVSNAHRPHSLNV